MLQVTQCIDLTTFFNQWRSYEPRGQEFESLRAHHTPERPIPSRSRPFCIPAAASGSRRQTLDIENANHPIRTGPGVFAERLYSKRLRHAQHHNSSLGSPFKRPAAMRVFFVCQPESSLASGTTTLASRAARLLTALCAPRPSTGNPLPAGLPDPLLAPWQHEITQTDTMAVNGHALTVNVHFTVYC